MNGEQERDRFQYDTLDEFINGLQFKLGHAAGCAQQILDWAETNQNTEFIDTAEIESDVKSIQDAVLHISAALKGLSK